MKFIKILILLLITQKLVAAPMTNFFWFNTTFQKSKIQNDLGLYFEYQNRLNTDIGKTSEQLFRPALFWDLNAENKVFLGYLYRSDSNYNQLEKRYWLQWLYKINTDDLTISLRTRPELRQLNNSDDLYRIRQQVRIQTKEVISLLSSKPFLHYEGFYNLNSISKTNSAGYVQERYGLGFQFKMNEQFALELGAMKQVVLNSATADQDNSILNLNILGNF